MDFVLATKVDDLKTQITEIESKVDGLVDAVGVLTKMIEAMMDTPIHQSPAQHLHISQTSGAKV
jgi:hypothetical protein